MGARYTWPNRQLSLARSVLDKVFVSANWESNYPLSSLKADTRIGSDHMPLFFSSEEELFSCNRHFLFELGWLEEYFTDHLKAKWDTWSSARREH